MKKFYSLLLLASALIPSTAKAVTIDELCRSYTGDVVVGQYMLFDTSVDNWTWYEPNGYTMNIVKGEGENAIVIKNFVPDMADLNATFDESTQTITIPVQTWPFDGYQFVTGSYTYDESGYMVITSDNPVTATVSDDGKIIFAEDAWGVRYGIYQDAYAYAGDGYFTPINTGAIEGIESDESNAPVEYFTIDGMRANGTSLSPGLYLRRQGSKVTKILVR